MTMDEVMQYHVDASGRSHWEFVGEKRIQDSIGLALSQVECRRYRSYKHTLFGLQEGKCNGCDVLFPFRNMTIDHIHPRFQGGTDASDNLQLLCAAYNATKGDRTQAYLIQVKLKE